MVILSADQIPSVIPALGNAVALTASQKTKIKTEITTEITTDPKARGYAAMSQFDQLVSICTPYSVDNGPAPMIDVRTKDPSLRKLWKAGAITDAQLIAGETDNVPDPNWVQFVPKPSRLENILNVPGACINIQEFVQAVA